MSIDLNREIREGKSLDKILLFVAERFNKNNISFICEDGHIKRIEFEQ